MALESRFGFRAPGPGEPPLPGDLARWVDEGIVTRSQAETIAVLLRPRGEPARSFLDEWVRRGLITAAQARAIARLPEQPTSSRPVLAAARPVWDTRFSSAPDSPLRDLRYVGLVAMVLAVLGASASLLGITTDLFIAPGRLLGADLGDLAHIGAAVACLAGATAVFRGNAGGKAWLMGGLLLNIAGLVFFPGSSLADPLVLIGLALWTVLLALTWRSHIPGRR